MNKFSEPIEHVLNCLLNNIEVEKFHVLNALDQLKSLKRNNEFINFDCFIGTVYITFKSHDCLRLGQTLMNHLYNVWPEKYNEITATEYDCFYDDKLFEKTLNKLKEDWSKK